MSKYDEDNEDKAFALEQQRLSHNKAFEQQMERIRKGPSPENTDTYTIGLDESDQDLKNRAFTGMRHNQFLNEFEYWIMGERKRSVKANAGPEKIAETFAEVFGFNPGQVD